MAEDGGTGWRISNHHIENNEIDIIYLINA